MTLTLQMMLDFLANVSSAGSFQDVTLTLIIPAASCCPLTAPAPYHGLPLLDSVIGDVIARYLQDMVLRLQVHDCVDWAEADLLLVVNV